MVNRCILMFLTFGRSERIQKTKNPLLRFLSVSLVWSHSSLKTTQDRKRKKKRNIERNREKETIFYPNLELTIFFSIEIVEDEIFGRNSVPLFLSFFFRLLFLLHPLFFFLFPSEKELEKRKFQNDGSKRLTTQLIVMTRKKEK